MSNDYGIGLGRGTVRRYSSDPGFSSYRSVLTPPPPGTSPHHRFTPDGVLTQVQRKVPASPGADSNSTDALFNDGFDFDDVKIPESGLSQSFPQCKINESGDLLSKVMFRSLSNNVYEEIKIPYKEGSIIVTPLPLHEDSNSQSAPGSSGYRDGGSMTSSSQSESRDGSVLGGKRSASSHHSSESPRQSKTGRDERDGQSFSDDPEFEDFSTSTHLSTARIRKMLKSLTPIPNPGGRGEENMDSSPSAEPVPAPMISKESSWGNQIPIKYQDQQGYEVLVPVAHGPIREERNAAGDPSGFSEEISSAVKQVRHALVKMVDGVVVGTGLEKHEFPLIPRSRVHVTDGDLDLDAEHDEKKIFRLTIPELILPLRDQVNVTFECNRIAKFLLVAWNRYTKRWSVPSRQRFHDVLNQVDSRIRRDRVPCHGVFRWNSEWEGGIGLMGLCITDVRALELFRTMVSEMAVGDLQYNTYPKDVLNHGTEVSLLLRAELKCLDLEFLPYSLFEKNRLLAGSTAVRYSKDLGRDDNNSNKSVPDKLVILDTDPDFRKSIHNYPPAHHFKVGTSFVKLRNEGEGHQQRQQQQQQQHPRQGDQQGGTTVVSLLGREASLGQARSDEGCGSSAGDQHMRGSSSLSSSSSSGAVLPSGNRRGIKAQWAKGHALPAPVPAKYRDADTRRLMGNSSLASSSSSSSNST